MILKFYDQLFQFDNAGVKIDKYENQNQRIMKIFQKFKAETDKKIMM